MTLPHVLSPSPHGGGLGWGRAVDGFRRPSPLLDPPPVGGRLVTQASGWGVIAALVVLVAAASPAAATPKVVAQVTATADVHDVAIDGDRILLATSGGLVVRQGDKTRVLTSRDGLPGTRLRSVSIAGGAVWVGGIDGAARLDPDLTVTRTLPLRRVRRVLAWRGAIWLASFGGGLHRLSGDAAPKRIDLGRFRDRLTDLAAHGDRLWVATAGAGVLVVDDRGRIDRLIDRRHGLGSLLVWDLEPDGETMLIATSAGIERARGVLIDRRAPIRRASRRLPIRDVRAVAAGGDRIIAATRGAGLWRLEGTRRRRLGRDDGRALAIGRAGVIVAHDRGASLVTGSGVETLIAGGLPSADITALARAFDRIWIGTFSAGLASMRGGRIAAARRATGRWGLDRRINDLAVTRDRAGERLWIATDRGLWWYDGRQFSREIDPGAPGRVHVTSLHVDRSGALWATSARTVARRRDGRWRAWTGDERQPMLQAHAVTTDGDGGVWIGTLAGLVKLDPATGRLERHDVATGDLPVDWVTAVVPFAGTIVAGTYHGGLAWVRPGRFDTEVIPGGWVNPHAMRVIDDTLWIGTLDRGLVIGKTAAWKRLRIADGLPSDDVTAMLVDGDHVWVGTRGGLARLRR